MPSHSPHHPITPSPHASPLQPVWEIIRFELQEGLRTRFALIAFAFFFAVGLLAVHVYGVDGSFFDAIRSTFGESTKPGELVLFANSPLRIMQIIGNATPFLLLVIVGIFADRATKDFVNNVDGLLFTSPLKEWQFVVGRLVASFLISLWIAFGVGLGMLVGQALPWMEPNRMAPFSLVSYLQPYLYLVIPNILIFGLFSFGLGLLTRRSLASYLGLVALWIFASILQGIVGALQLDPLFTVLVNPVGTNTIDYAVRFWTKVQQNTLYVPFVPAIWLSRLFYLVLSVAFFAWVWQRFSFSGATTASSPARLETLLAWAEQRLLFWKSNPPPEPATGNRGVGEVSRQTPIAHLHHGLGAQLRHAGRIAAMELKRLLWNPLVLAVLAISILALIIGLISTVVNSPKGAVQPTTWIIVELVNNVVNLLAPLLIIFLAGDLVWREREVKIDPLSDPLPVRSWAVTLGKLLALGLILVLTLVLFVLGGVIAQTLNDYPHYDLGVYGIGLFTVTLVHLLLISVMAITIQVLVNQKFLGYFLSAAIIIVLSFASGSAALKDFRLLQYGYKPSYYYGDLSGYGRMLEPVRWFQFYWVAIAILLFCISALFWVRGIDTHPKARWRIARQRFTRPMQMVMALSAIAALGLGFWIFYNTHLLHPELSRAEITDQAIAYEKAYGRLIDAQPKTTAINLQGDLYPDQDSRFTMRGTYTLENKTQKAIDTILLNVPNGIQVNQITVNGKPAKATANHPAVQGYEFALASPLPPGASVEAAFDLLIKPAAGFTGEAPGATTNDLLENGTSLMAGFYLPIVGFQERPRLKDNQRREAAGLPQLDAAAEAAKLVQRSMIRSDADLVQYSATLSTASDQIAITSGELVRQWTDRKRRYFQYKSQVPIENQIPIFSGRYEVLREEWQGMPIEIYYHKGHDRNLQRIVNGAQKTLDYATQNFGAYPHKSLRFVEVPYVSEAVSSPSTITAGERSIFLFSVNDNDPDTVDNAFRIAAHETAHQWWGAQLMPSAVPGGKLLTESLAEYTAYQVFAKEYGQEKLGIALRKNLDTYLQNRRKSDVPLVEAETNHLVYEKGSLAMYALQDYLGENVVNQALAKFLKEKSIVPPYPSSQDLVAALRQLTPTKYQYLIHDLFETVTLYNNSAEAATVKPRSDGKYDVTLKLNLEKVRSNNNGNETPVSMNDKIDVGVYDTTGKLIYLKKHLFKGGGTELVIAVNQRPQKAGIDPLNKLIDKVPDDNLTAVKDTAN